jgi:hypothetical protein
MMNAGSTSSRMASNKSAGEARRIMITDFFNPRPAIWYHPRDMSRQALDQAYPGISFRPRSRGWLARLMRWPAECVHLEAGHTWMATFIPDTLYLRGKPSPRRDDTRPEVSICLDCLTALLEPELAAFPGRVVAFEPDAESFTQYFFVERNDFTAAGLRPEIAAAIEARAENIVGACSDCGYPATWLWISRREVSSLDQTERIETSPGGLFCSRHGAAKLCDALGKVHEANLFYVNAPYGESGAYVWI